MGNSNSSLEKELKEKSCSDIAEALEKCCLDKATKQLKEGKIEQPDPCEKLKEIYLSKCDSKEDFKKQLINC